MTYCSFIIGKFNIKLPVLIFCLICLGATSLDAQTWERFYNFHEFDNLKSAILTEDGGILCVGHALTITGVPNSVGDVMMVKTDRDGNVLWEKTYDQDDSFEEIFRTIPTSDGNYLLGGLTYNQDGSNGNADGWILKMDPDGNILWDRKYGGLQFERIFGLHETADGGFVFTGSTRSEVSGDIIEPPVGAIGEKDSWIGKINAEGDLLWNHRFGSEEDDILKDLTIASNGDILAVGNYLTAGIGGSWDISLYRFDPDGNAIWNQVHGGDGYEEAFSIIATSSGNFAIGGMTSSQGNGSADTYLLQIDPEGNIIDEDTYGGADGEFAGFVQEMPDGGFSILSSTESLGSPLLDVYLIRTEPNGEERWSKVFDGGNDRYDVPYPFSIDENGYYYIVAQQQDKDSNGEILSTHTYLIKADELGNTTTNTLRGKVAIDEGDNCFPENGEQGLKDWLVVARGANQTYYNTTDTNGEYFIELKTGNYSVEVIPPGDYWEACDEVVFLSIDNAYDTTLQNFNFSDESIVCADMEVDLSTPFLNYCGENIYNVIYRNNGTTISSGAAVDVIIPNSFSLVSSTIPLGGVDDSLYTFNIAEVPVNATEIFQITVAHDCSGQIDGLTYAFQARISPEQICLSQDPIWDESSIEIRSKIVGEDIQFIVENIGPGDMEFALTGVIIEDWLLPRTEPIQLNSFESDTITVTPGGKTIRLEVPQTPGHPGRSNPAITVEGVGTNDFGGITTGYVNHYAEDDANLFKSIDAQISYDNFLPNVLRGFPRGYGNDRAIAPNGDIEYHLRFQHTGNDTLPWLYIENELPEELDVETLRPGASSHPYDYEVVGNGVVRFNFNNLNLVGDEIDEAASYGFIKFRVSQQPNLPDGTGFFNTITVQKPEGRERTNSVWHSIKYQNTYSAYIATHCAGDTLFGRELIEDVVLRDTISRMAAPDSIISARVFVVKNEITEVLVELEPGELYNEILYTEDTTLTKFYVAANGCDSIVNTQLDVLTKTTSLEYIFQLSLYPNPGYKQVTMSYRLPASSGVEIRLYQSTGKLYQNIDKGHQSVGTHRMILPDHLPTGIYWVELRTGEGTVTKKLVIQ